MTAAEANIALSVEVTPPHVSVASVADSNYNHSVDFNHMYSLLAEDIVLSHVPYRFSTQSSHYLQARSELTEWATVKA